MFKALLLEKPGESLTAHIRDLGVGDLPDGDVRLGVLYSSLNFKDGLAVTGKGKIIRGAFPFVPGIDLVGRVEASDSIDLAEGDLVIGTGWGLGENHWGGYSQQQRLQAAWLVRLPAGMSPYKAMVAGTAGFTAMLSLLALEEHDIRPDSGPVVVSGASGGVGSIAVFLLARAGYDVVASTGKESSHDFLRELGASGIIQRDELGAGAARPLDNARWAAAVDTVGGPTLAAILSQLDRHGAVAACGLAQSHALETTVFPFILRGVNLLGIDSNTCPPERRVRAWERLAATLDDRTADRMARVIPLEAVPDWAEKIVAGEVQGRIVVDVNA
jgi:acrylyl-CoA reductase (NADPH)